MSKLSEKKWMKFSLGFQNDIVMGQAFLKGEEKRFLALGLAGEVGEVCNLLKKDWRGDYIEKELIQEEIADCFVYLSLLAVKMDMDDIDSHIEAKLKKVQKRMEEEDK